MSESINLQEADSLTEPAEHYEMGVRYAYDASYAESPELQQRYYEKALRMFERAANQGHAAAMMGLLTIRLADSSSTH